MVSRSKEAPVYADGEASSFDAIPDPLLRKSLKNVSEGIGKVFLLRGREFPKVEGRRIPRRSFPWGKIAPRLGVRVGDLETFVSDTVLANGIIEIDKVSLEKRRTMSVFREEHIIAACALFCVYRTELTLQEDLSLLVRQTKKGLGTNPAGEFIREPSYVQMSPVAHRVREEQTKKNSSTKAQGASSARPKEAVEKPGIPTIPPWKTKLLKVFPISREDREVLARFGILEIEGMLSQLPKDGDVADFEDVSAGIIPSSVASFLSRVLILTAREKHRDRFDVLTSWGRVLTNGEAKRALTHCLYTLRAIKTRGVKENPTCLDIHQILAKKLGSAYTGIENKQ